MNGSIPLSSFRVSYPFPMKRDSFLPPHREPPFSPLLACHFHSSDERQPIFSDERSGADDRRLDSGDCKATPTKRAGKKE
ncbi:unnamed protein product [Larinioides sclopetarius]|uniref:Uncharacterized protein n=1 Tax=Larinioides sclopetarius TaxID=280406 RepID=A0AAV2B4U7_9ARAC